MHLDLRQLRENVGNIGEFGPIELQVLARGEMAKAPVIGARDVGELVQLARGQGAIRDGDAEHVGMQLQIDAILEAQRLEFVLGQFAAQAAADLIAKLGHALAHKLGIKFVVTVHA